MFVMMLYVSTERAGWVVLGTLLFAAGAYFGYLNFGHVARGWVPGWTPSRLRRLLPGDQRAVRMAWGGLLGLVSGWADRSDPAGPQSISSPPRLAKSSA
jgi:hypothetical protein